MGWGGGLELYIKSCHFLLASTGPQGACKRYCLFAEVEYGDGYVLAPVELKGEKNEKIKLHQYMTLLNISH